MRYTIQQGDTLYNIAKNLTLDPSYYLALANLNNISDPNVIYAGHVIEIPDEWTKGYHATGTADGTPPISLPAPMPVPAPTIPRVPTNSGMMLMGIPIKYFVYGGLALVAFSLLSGLKKRG